MDETTNKQLPAPAARASPSPAIAEPALPARNPPPKPRLIPRRIREAIKLYTEGRTKTWRAAADKVGISHEHMYRTLAKPHVAAYLRDRAAHVVAMGVGRAAPRLNQLMDSPSQRTALDAVKYSLGTAGIKPASDAVNVNVGARFGFRIDLREDRSAPLPEMLDPEAGGDVIVDAPAVGGKVIEHEAGIVINAHGTVMSASDPSLKAPKIAGIAPGFKGRIDD
jgi:hypothetical protein